MEISPDGRTVYFGRYRSYEHDRMNLGVLSLDANGQPIGDIRYFSDCDITKYPLALDSRSSVIKIIIDRNIQKLYLIAYEELLSTSSRQFYGYHQKYYVTIYSLQNGIPVLLKKCIPSPIFNPSPDHSYTMYALALDSTKHRLYFGGDDTRVWYWILNSDGIPDGDPQKVDFGLLGIYDIAVAENPDLNLLYIGSYGVGTETPTEPAGPLLEVIGLNSDGSPGPSSPKSWNFGPSDPAVWPSPPHDDNTHLQFHYTPNAIYRRRTSMRTHAGSPAEVWPIIVWPLNQTGNNIGYPISQPPDTPPLPWTTQHSVPTTNPYADPYLGFAESIDIQTNTIWIAKWNTFCDKFNPHPDLCTSGETLPCVSGVTVNQYNLDINSTNPTYLPTGDPIPTSSSGPIDKRYGMLLANAPSQLPVLLTQVGSVGGSSFDNMFIGNYLAQNIVGYYLKITIVDAQPSSLIPPDGFPVYLQQISTAGHLITVDPFDPHHPDNYVPPITPNPLPLGQSSDQYPLGSPGDPSPPGSLLQADSGHIGPYVFRLVALPLGGTSAPGNFQSLRIRIDIYRQGESTPCKILNTAITDPTLAGDDVLFILPSYNFSRSPHPGEDPDVGFLEQIDLYSDYIGKYVALSQSVAVDPNDRPRDFVISVFSMRGLQGSLLQMQYEVEILANLGINTISTAAIDPSNFLVDYEWPGLDVGTVQAILNNAGLKYRSCSTQGPFYYYSKSLNGPPPNGPGITLDIVHRYFDFYLYFNTEQLNDWAKQVASNVYDSYAGVLANVVELHLLDEPTWEYPALLDIINNYPLPPPASGKMYLPIFQNYLKSLPQGFRPSYFGFSSWDQVTAIGASEANVPSATTENRHLFFWTMRFFAEQASQGVARTIEALNNAFATYHINIFANWNNWNGADGIWYQSTGAGGGDAQGLFDWAYSGRLNAAQKKNVLTLWTEDDFFDQQAQKWSFLGDILRSAGMLTPEYGSSPPLPGEPGGFGGFIDGYCLAGYRYLGGHPAGGTYKILALIGHGAKDIILYNYGPYPIGGNEWSEYQTVYQPIADAIRLVGRAEKLLYPGRPKRGNVAIYLPGISNLWDPLLTGSTSITYQFEIWFLYYALIHAGYTVDFVDDYDLAIGALNQRNYTTLYVTGPNVANDTNQNAQDQINDWVRNQGGVLVVTPGGGVADEYNSSTTIFDTILGLVKPVAGGADPRDLPRSNLGNIYNFPFDVAGTLAINDAHFGSGTIYISNPICQLTIDTGDPNPASIAAIFSLGDPANPTIAPAITIHQYGSGYGIAYAFYPGIHYQQSANWDESSNEPSQGAAFPYGWGKIQRDLVVGPAKIARTPKPITLTQDGKPLELVESCLLESDKGIAIVLLNWSDTWPNHVPIKDLTITINDQDTNVPVGSLISSAQGNVITPTLTTSALPPFTITLSQLDYVDVIMIDTGPHLVRTETVSLSGVIESAGNMAVVDVSPFHIIGGHLSIYASPPQSGLIPIPQVLAAEIIDNQIQHAVSLDLDAVNDRLAITDLSGIITGNNPISNNPNETVSHITHLLLYNGTSDIFELPPIVAAMTIIYSP